MGSPTHLYFSVRAVNTRRMRVRARSQHLKSLLMPIAKREPPTLPRKISIPQKTHHTKETSLLRFLDAHYTLFDTMM